MQCLQRILDSRGGKFDGEVREIMILVKFGAVRQAMEGVWVMRTLWWRLRWRVMSPKVAVRLECTLHSSALFDV